MTKKCIICQKPFEAKGKAKCCSPECVKELRRKYSREYARKTYEVKLKKSKKGVSTLDEDIRHAREQGITYGEYKAKQYLEEMKNVHKGM